MADEALVAAFDQEMFRIYERARSEANYNATRFLHMLYEHRGLETARILLHSPKSQKAIQPSGSEDAPRHLHSPWQFAGAWDYSTERKNFVLKIASEVRAFMLVRGPRQRPQPAGKTVGHSLDASS